jgi:uncharacterized membrane protein
MQVVIAAFNDEKSAKESLTALNQAKRAGLIDIQDAAILRRDAKNKLHVKDINEMTTGKGAMVGAVTGGVIGLLAGPLVMAGAAGALVGALASKLRDTGFSNQRLQQIGDGLKPGSSAIIAVIEHKWVEAVQKELEKAANDVLVQEISSDIAAQLEAGKEVAYTALAMQGGLITGRATKSEGEVEISGLALTEDGLVAGAALITAEDNDNIVDAEAVEEA